MTVRISTHDTSLFDQLKKSLPVVQVEGETAIHTWITLIGKEIELTIFKEREDEN